MSKTQLRKELANFDAQKLREIILDLYDARKEAKDYLEFFINPDVDKKMEAVTVLLSKEIGRVKRRLVSPRWTRVNQIIRDFQSLNPGAEYVLKMYWAAVRLAMDERAAYYVSASFDNGLYKLFEKMLQYGDKNQVLDTLLNDILYVFDKYSEYRNRDVRNITADFHHTLSTFQSTLRP